MAYRLQRALLPNAGFRWLSAGIEASGPGRTLFTNGERRAKQGRTSDLRLLHRPTGHRRWGQSSWLNYWQGRDDGL
jgi:hypothetical protein